MDDNGQRVITIAHPELCSGELIKAIYLTTVDGKNLHFPQKIKNPYQAFNIPCISVQ